MKTIKKLVEAFLAWPLPDSVSADVCATKKGYPNRVGTCLLTADEARQMFEHVSGSMALDHEIIENEDGSFEVWTPDKSGAVIGCGKNRAAALRDAIASMGATISSLAEEIST